MLMTAFLLKSKFPLLFAVTQAVTDRALASDVVASLRVHDIASLDDMTFAAQPFAFFAMFNSVIGPRHRSKMSGIYAQPRLANVVNVLLTREILVNKPAIACTVCVLGAIGVFDAINPVAFRVRGATPQPAFPFWWDNDMPKEAPQCLDRYWDQSLIDDRFNRGAFL
jgi:hypothetical protein